MSQIRCAHCGEHIGVVAWMSLDAPVCSYWCADARLRGDPVGPHASALSRRIVQVAGAAFGLIAAGALLC